MGVRADVLRAVWPDLCSEAVLLLTFNLQLATEYAAVADLEVTHLLDAFHRFVSRGELGVVNDIPDEVKILCVGQRTRAALL